MKRVYLITGCLIWLVQLNAQEVYKNWERGYAIEIPKGWQEIPYREVENLSNNSSGYYDIGFYPIKERGQYWEFPYVLIQFMPTSAI